ncbi:MAG: RNA polymerase-binding transcription factor DksA [Alphaproteobacteria bacterium MarineAlpha6_Bin4]|nr:MAG: RNA polymerase-binding transcription factor DksA [Alphaproteobacteria bacterium MarineAlpha6_Bin3]PPR37264.1 MAG: RNA polymerase-binding transcription factor DksA [Alphaproteobacteria bacterium MarineAlpha6_Bin4]|tara:strand:- start:1584 stop:2003 length:420 start_codon:yes stop_codon:yes gene_type:complete
MAVKKKTTTKYKPSAKEPFMNAKQKQYFKQKLLDWKESLLKGSNETITNLKEDKEVSGDFADIASAESAKSIELRTRDRERKLINKIDEALKRIENNTYGFCEITGKPINLKRLEARPIATLSIEAQQMHENQEQLNND